MPRQIEYTDEHDDDTPDSPLTGRALDWGINGVWWTLTITSIIKSLVLAGWFKLGRWKRKEL